MKSNTFEDALKNMALAMMDVLPTLVGTFAEAVTRDILAGLAGQTASAGLSEGNATQDTITEKAASVAVSAAENH